MNGIQRTARALGRTAGRLRGLVGELNYAQRRMTVLFLSADRYQPGPDRPPACYGDFLFRTAGPLIREPSSCARLAGRAVG